MRLYFELARRSFRQQFAYRGAALAGIFTNSVFGIMIASIFVAYYHSVGGDVAVAGWQRDQTVTLTWINQALLMTVYIWGWWEIARAIQSGAIITELLKPYDYFAHWLARDLGRAAAHFLIRGIPTFLVGVIAFNLLAPVSFAAAGGFLVSIVFAVTTSFCLRFMANALSFWLVDYRGMTMVYVAVVNFFSGMLAPLAFLPGPVRDVANVLPFRGMMIAPSEIYLGQVPIWQGLALQLGWIAVLVWGGRWLLRAGERKLVVQGG